MSQNLPILTYRAAQLKKVSGVWLIEYYALHPQKKELSRVRIKLTRIAKRYTRLSDFKDYAHSVINAINAKLAGGWSPFMEEQNMRYYTPITEVIRLFLQEKEKETRTNTMRSYNSFCSMFLTWCADNNLKDCYASLINKVIVIRYLDYVYMEKNVRPVTYNNYIKLGKALFSWAVEKCYVKDNPFLYVHPKKEQEKRRAMIPAEWRARIVSYLQDKNPSFLIVCHLVFTSLIRPNEIQLIQLKHLHLYEKYIEIPATNAKNHHTRCAALSDKLIYMISSLPLERYSADYYLFSSDLMPGKKPCGAARFRKEWDKMRNALSMPSNMQLYSLRDTGINALLKSGVDSLSVMQHADHHDLEMTTKYANHADPDLINKINRVAPLF